MSLYSKIVNPKTGRLVYVNGRIGKQIIKNYLKMLGGASADTVERTATETTHRAETFNQDLIEEIRQEYNEIEEVDKSEKIFQVIWNPELTVYFGFCKDINETLDTDAKLNLYVLDDIEEQISKMIEPDTETGTRIELNFENLKHYLETDGVKLEIPITKFVPGRDGYTFDDLIPFEDLIINFNDDLGSIYA